MTDDFTDDTRHGKRGHHPARLPDYSWFEIYTVSPDDGLYIRAQFDEGTIERSGGGGGWKSVMRPQRRPLTAYVGPDTSFTYRIPLVFDGYRRGNSMLPQLRDLEKMAGVMVPGDPKPPLLIINANGALEHDVFHEPGNRWVIPEMPTYGDQLLNDEGHIVQMHIKVPLMLHTADDRLSRAKQVARAKYVTARSGDTYNKIAARALKAYGGQRWGNRLAHLNGARDGASRPHVGQLVRIPTAAQVESWRRTPRR